MSAHNIHFHQEIRKLPTLSGAMYNTICSGLFVLIFGVNIIWQVAKI